MGAKSAQAKAYQGLLSTAKKDYGYTGSADVDDLIAFANENNINLEDVDAIRRAFKAYKVEVLEESDRGLVLAVMDDSGEAMDEPEDEEAKESGEEDETVKNLRSAVKQLKFEVKELKRAAPVRTQVTVPGEKEFKRLARKGATCFQTHEDAFHFTNWLIAGTDLGQKVSADRRTSAVKSLGQHGIKINTTAFAADGGAAVPEQFVADIWDYQSEYGVARRYSDVQPMSSDQARRTKNGGGDGAGFVGYFTAEGTAPTLSGMTLAGANLNAQSFRILGLMSRELLDDSPINLGEFAARAIATVSQKREDECLFIGDGSSTYAGTNGLSNQFGSTATSDSRSVTGGGTASGHTIANIHSVMGKLPSRYRTGAAFYCHPTMTAEIFDRLLGAQGGVSWEESQRFGLVKRALGHPIIEVEVMNGNIDASGDAIDLYFGNLPAACMFGDRKSLEVEFNPHRYWDQGAIGVQGWTRFDVNVHELGSSTEAGPLVALYQT
ncbi:MAG: phage major capsid protein [Planctomycetota bacterium]